MDSWESSSIGRWWFHKDPRKQLKHHRDYQFNYQLQHQRNNITRRTEASGMPSRNWRRWKFTNVKFQDSTEVQVRQRKKLWRKEERLTPTGRKRRGIENTRRYYQQGEVRPQARRIWKLYMNVCGHGVQKKSTPYLLQTGRVVMSTGTLLTPTHYQPTLQLWYRRRQTS